MLTKRIPQSNRRKRFILKGSAVVVVHAFERKKNRKTKLCELSRQTILTSVTILTTRAFISQVKLYKFNDDACYFCLIVVAYLCLSSLITYSID